MVRFKYNVKTNRIGEQKANVCQWLVHWQNGGKMKKILLVMTLISTAVLFVSCKADKNANEQGSENQSGQNAAITAPADNNADPTLTPQADKTDEFEPVTLSVSGWDVTIQNAIRNDTMNNVSVVLGYTDATTNEFEVKAPEGYDYYLIKMTITKKDSKENIEWDRMTLTDSEGNVYKRTEDTFISDLGMKRLPGTTLNFGSNEGWIAFEVKKEATGFTLSYDFADEDLTYSFAD
jgi:uncharacterized protein YcnI